MKAMVLCAGFGTRLGSLTREIPKPMLDVNGRPILEWILFNLRRHGFDEVVINLHFQPQLIRDYFGEGSRYGMRLTYSYEAKLLGTAGGLKNVAGFFEHEPSFLVHYGDVITDQDFRAMLQQHQKREALATLLLHRRSRSNSVVVLDSDSRITGFLERPSEEARAGINSSWVNSGICLCNPEILEHIPEQTVCDLPKDVFTKQVHAGRLYGYPLSGYRVAVDSPERLEEARQAIQEGRCCIPPLP